jgi:hypothetical protein
MASHGLKLRHAVEFSIRELCRHSKCPVFLTLTFKDNVTDKADAEKRWSRLRERLRRKYPDLSGVGVWQRQSRGAWHLHAIISQPMPVDWLRPAAVECGFGAFVDLKFVNQRDGFRGMGGPEKCARYMARYVTREWRDDRDKSARLVCYIGDGRSSSVRFSWVRGLHQLWRIGRAQWWDIFGATPKHGEWMFVVRLGWECLDEYEQEVLLQSSRAVRQWWNPEEFPPDPF